MYFFDLLQMPNTPQIQLQAPIMMSVKVIIFLIVLLFLFFLIIRLHSVFIYHILSIIGSIIIIVFYFPNVNMFYCFSINYICFIITIICLTDFCKHFWKLVRDVNIGLILSATLIMPAYKLHSINLYLSTISYYAKIFFCTQNP